MAFGALHEQPSHGNTADLDKRIADVCGHTWQDKYAAFHAAESAKPEPRLMIFDVTGNGGYADRLTGLMTTLLLAILTDRAIVISWPGYDSAFKLPRLVADNRELLAKAQRAGFNDIRRLHWVNENRTKLTHDIVGPSGGLDAFFPERVVYIRSNRGFTQALLKAPGLADVAWKRGLTPSNAQFGCLFNFLISPTTAAMSPQEPILDALRDHRYATVGVHVRAGDSTWGKEGGVEDSDEMKMRGRRLYSMHHWVYDYAFSLATNISDKLAAAVAANPHGDQPYRPKPRLLLLGDSPALRNHVANEAFRGRSDQLLLPATTAEIGHIAYDAGALNTAVGEHWLYGNARAFVYSSHSGFPRTAAARAVSDEAIHTCFHYTGTLFNSNQPTERECTGPYSVAHLGDRHAAGL